MKVSKGVPVSADQITTMLSLKAAVDYAISHDTWVVLLFPDKTALNKHIAPYQAALPKGVVSTGRTTILPKGKVSITTCGEIFVPPDESFAVAFFGWEGALPFAFEDRDRWQKAAEHVLW